MKIAFLVDSTHISGGTYVVFQHAVYLARNGHDVVIVTEDLRTEAALAWHPEAYSHLTFKTYAEVVGDHFDIACATWWLTVFRLGDLSASRYHYFVQSIESRFYPENDWAGRSCAELTYGFTLPIITEATWIQRYLADKYGHTPLLARNGIRKDIYLPTGQAIAPREKGKLRVLVEGPLGVFFKNVERTVELALESVADEVWLLTSTPAVKDYPGVDRTFCCVSISECAEIYRSCDVILKLSYVEGMFGPPLEMFHCGGTAIVYDVTGHDEYIRHGVNAIVVARDDEEGVLHALQDLKYKAGLYDRLCEGAIQTASAWPSWESSSKLFAEKFLGPQSSPGESAETLRRIGRLAKSWFENHRHLQRVEKELRAECGSLEAEVVRERELREDSERMLQMILTSRKWRVLDSLGNVPLLRSLVGRN